MNLPEKPLLCCHPAAQYWQNSSVVQIPLPGFQGPSPRALTSVSKLSPWQPHHDHSSPHRPPRLTHATHWTQSVFLSPVSVLPSPTSYMKSLPTIPIYNDSPFFEFQL